MNLAPGGCNVPYFHSVGYIDDSLSQDEVAKEYRRRYSLAAYHRRRETIIQELGGECAACGSKEGLSFIKDKDSPVDFVVNKLATMAETKRTQVMPYVSLLCESHASEALHNKGRLTHGTYWAAYKCKCKCEDCDEYRANRSLERREDRRSNKPEQPPARGCVPTIRRVATPQTASPVEEEQSRYDLSNYVPFSVEDNVYTVPDTSRSR
jgi:hypothetical protein